MMARATTTREGSGHANRNCPVLPDTPLVGLPTAVRAQCERWDLRVDGDIAHGGAWVVFRAVDYWWWA
jgi:hypothetical protein